MQLAIASKHTTKQTLTHSASQRIQARGTARSPPGQTSSVAKDFTSSNDKSSTDELNELNELNERATSLEADCHIRTETNQLVDGDRAGNNDQLKCQVLKGVAHLINTSTVVLCTQLLLNGVV